jgi:hypothetical protein
MKTGTEFAWALDVRINTHQILMKISTYLKITSAGSAALAAALFLTTPSGAIAGGTDILHFTDFVSMTNNGVEPDAAGMVLASQKTQGHANNQKLTIAVMGLATNTPYELVVTYDADTNMVDVGTFTTDNKGKASFNYTSLGNGHGGGHKSIPLPGSVNPVSLIREVGIVDTNLQAVLTADLTDPDKLEYLVKRDLSHADIKADLFIQATTKKTQFRLTSSGLAPSTDYLLAFNGEIVQTNTTSANGKLNINSLVDTPPAS